MHRKIRNVKFKFLWSRKIRMRLWRCKHWKRNCGSKKVSFQHFWNMNKHFFHFFFFFILLQTDITIISSDMRDFKPTEMGDILVSELLGSFGDNELSPECLDGAQKHLKPDGISIPSRSTSYLNPVMSPKLMNIIRDVRSHTYRGEIPQPSHELQSESTYVVYLKNAYHIAAPKPVFSFDHPNQDAVIDNSRYTTLSFDVTQDCLLTGFAGYFDTVLYKDIMLSIHPETHSDGLSSWFPMYFPLAEPQQVRAGQTISVNIWRCVSSNKVWYEWNTSAPIISHIHNANGLACPIYKWNLGILIKGCKINELKIRANNFYVFILILVDFRVLRGSFMTAPHSQHKSRHSLFALIARVRNLFAELFFSFSFEDSSWIGREGMKENRSGAWTLESVIVHSFFLQRNGYHFFILLWV